MRNLVDLLKRRKELIREGKSQSEIAEAEGVSRQAIHDYMIMNGLKVISTKDKKDYDKKEKVKRLIEDGKTRGEIAEGLGVLYPYICKFIKRHNDLPVPKKDERKGRVLKMETYERIRGLVEEGKSQGDIANEMSYVSPQCVSNYLRRHPELRALWKENKRKGRGRK